MSEMVERVAKVLAAGECWPWDLLAGEVCEHFTRQAQAVLASLTTFDLAELAGESGFALIAKPPEGHCYVALPTPPTTRKSAAQKYRESIRSLNERKDQSLER